MNPRLDMVKWIHRRVSQAVRSKEYTGPWWENSRTKDYFGSLFNFKKPEESSGNTLFCGGAQIPPDSIKKIS
jgi:hypothetical protein